MLLRKRRRLPELVGGSADLAHSNLTLWTGSKSVAGTDPDANYIYYGVREFGMSAISNGLALHGGFVPYDATFLVFSDYARNAVRIFQITVSPAAPAAASWVVSAIFGPPWLMPERRVRSNGTAVHPRPPAQERR